MNLGSVITTANPRGAESKALITLKRLALFARRLLSLLSTVGLRLAGNGAELRCVKIHSLPKGKVFCLNTPSPHSFYTTNGVVVKNCGDQIRYMAMARPFIRNQPKEELSLEKKFRKPTMDEVWSLRDQMMNPNRRN